MVLTSVLLSMGISVRESRAQRKDILYILSWFRSVSGSGSTSSDSQLVFRFSSRVSVAWTLSSQP